MKTIPHKTERLHALDSLRAIMMMLGIVLHAVITYNGAEPGTVWRIRDPINFNENLGWIGACIHIFRMPIFMVVAGFFASLLFYERGPRWMFKNRMNRITYPFLVFVVLLFVPVVGGMSYTANIFANSSNALSEALAPFTSLTGLIPNRTMHLWFLYYLIMFSLVSFGLGLLFKKLPDLSSFIHRSFHTIFKNPILRLFVFTALTIGILLFMNKSWVDTSTSFVPDFNTFIFYFFFYMFGWVLFKSKSLLSSFKKYDYFLTATALIIFTWYFFADVTDMNLWLKITVNAFCCWLFIFGITGLFIRFGSEHSAAMRYVSDASYWVYLVHLPLTVILPGLIADWNIPATFKFLFVVSVTTVVCFVTYHYLVRSTFIGEFLNGRRYTKKLSDIKPVVQPEPEVKMAFDK